MEAVQSLEFSREELESRAPSFRVKAMEAVPSLEFSREELPGVEGAER